MSNVFELLRQYFSIALLAGRPQELPGGPTQMHIGIALAVSSYLLALVSSNGLSLSIAHVIIDLGGTAIALHLALKWVGHRGRFEQAFGGLCGASAFINVAAIPVYISQPVDRSTEVSAGAALAGFVLLVWSLSLLAHVIRHTFEIRLGASIAVAFVWFIVVVGVMDAVIPTPATPVVDERLEGSGTVRSSLAMI